MSTKKYLAFDSIGFGIRSIRDHFSTFIKSFLIFFIFCIILSVFCWVKKGILNIEDVKLIIQSIDPFNLESYSKACPGVYFA